MDSNDNRQIARTLVQKGDASVASMTAAGGVLLPTQAKQFYQIAIDDTKLLPMISTPPLNSAVEEIDKIGFTSRITRRGNEGQALSNSDRGTWENGKTTFTTVPLKFQVNVSEEILEDNIEGEALNTKILQMAGQRFGLDAEDLIVNGNTSSTDPLLKLLNGILVKATSHVVDNGAHMLCEDDFFAALQLMPSAFKKNLANLRFFTSGSGELRWRYAMSRRAGGGGGIGDAAIVSSNPIPAFGVPVVDIPVFPTDLGTGTNETNTLLCDPKNIAMGVWKQVKIKSAEDIQAGVYMIVGRARLDVQFFHEPAVVKVVKQLTS